MKRFLFSFIFFSSISSATTHIIDYGQETGITFFGRNTHIMLDANGFPVISFTDSSTESLFLLHCNDATCQGGDEIANTVVSGLGGVAADYGLDLDSNGFPVMSFYDANNTDLMIIQCVDAGCSSPANINTLSNIGDIGSFSDLKLDASDNPVISYVNDTNNSLNIIHCNDEICSGGVFSLIGGYPNGVGEQSLELDDSGFPVVAFNGDFRPRLLRCNDVNCSGSNESIQLLDSFYAPKLELELDSSDVPVVAYVKNGGPSYLIHCNDINCDPAVNGTETGNQFSTSATNMDFKLGAAGPVIVTLETSKFNIILCNDPDCNGNDEFSTTLTYSGSFHTGLQLDSSGFPVAVAYTSTGVGGGSSGVNVIHCNDPFCLGNNEANNYINKYKIDVGQYARMQRTGNQFFWSYYDASGNILKFRHCNTLPCNTSDIIQVIDSTNDVGTYNFMALDSGSNPFVSYFDATNQTLRIAECDNAECSTRTNFTIDSSANLGKYSSVIFDSSGFPVISYSDYESTFLKVAHCDTTNCVSFTNHINTVDSFGEYTSIALDTSGFPMISYYEDTAGALKLAHCNDADCDSSVNGSESINVVDSGSGNTVGQFTSLKLDLAGFPVISYYDVTAGALKLAHCINESCSSGNSVVTVDDGNGNDVGKYNSLDFDSNGFPVISYYDETEGNLKLAKCSDENCVAFIAKVVVSDTDDVGQFSSLSIDGETAYISYYNATKRQLETVDIALPDIIFADSFE